MGVASVSFLTASPVVALLVISGGDWSKFYLDNDDLRPRLLLEPFDLLAPFANDSADHRSRNHRLNKVPPLGGINAALPLEWRVGG